ncbi:MAG: AgmX/PglI C-terminal domain-containing protein [Deltaproteobacteria bacterium]|nr:AgmX/PglI C-terminal domain-containing protein [Deltaproteobacteria bacterium]
MPVGYLATAEGDAPLRWSLTGPAGASVDAQSGAVTWTSPAPGDLTFRLEVENDTGKATQAWTTVVVPLPGDDGGLAPDDAGVPDDVLAPESTLFEPTASGYRLVLADSMDGRLGAAGALTPLRALAARVPARPDGTRCLPLPDAARGKVTCGDVTVLFQLVTPPAPRPAPRLPASVRGSFAAQVDRTMAGVLGGSFAVHLALFVYLGLFVEIPRNPDIEDEFRNLPVRSIPVALRQPEAKRSVGSESKVAEPVASPTRLPRRLTPVARRPLSDAERIAEARRLAAGIGILKPIVSRGPGGQGFFADALAGGSAQSNMDAALKRLGGVRPTTTEGLTGLATRGGAFGGGHVKSIADLGRDVGAVRDTGTPTGEKKERRVSVRFDKLRETDTDLTDVEGANRTLRNGYGAMKACYDRGLKRDHGLSGKLAVRITVSGAGTVTGVMVRQATLADPDVVSCMTASIRAWRFPPAGGGRVAAVEPTWVFKAGD